MVWQGMFGCGVDGLLKCAATGQTDLIAALGKYCELSMKIKKMTVFEFVVFMRKSLDESVKKCYRLRLVRGVDLYFFLLILCRAVTGIRDRERVREKEREINN